MKNLPKIKIAALMLASVYSSTLLADDQKFRRFTSAVVKGVTVTGPNRFCGEQLWTFEEQGVNPLSFRQVGAYSEGNERPEDLTVENCTDDQVLATIHDPLLSTIGIVAKPDVRLENIPLRDVPRTPGVIGGGPDGRRVFAGAAEEGFANPFPVQLSNPSDPITLGKWSEAKGLLSYRCFADGTASLKARFFNLIENGVYSMWGIFRITAPDGSIIDLPSPLGGIPNAVVANHRGDASFVRKLSFCPGEETSNGSLLLWATLAYHSDSALYGGVPEPADLPITFVDKNGETFVSPLSLTVHHEHVAFPINFTSRIK